MHWRLTQITVQFRGILKSASFPNSQIYSRFVSIRLELGHTSI